MSRFNYWKTVIVNAVFGVFAIYWLGAAVDVYHKYGASVAIGFIILALALTRAFINPDNF